MKKLSKRFAVLLVTAILGSNVIAQDAETLMPGQRLTLEQAKRMFNLRQTQLSTGSVVYVQVAIKKECKEIYDFSPGREVDHSLDLIKDGKYRIPVEIFVKNNANQDKLRSCLQDYARDCEGKFNDVDRNLSACHWVTIAEFDLNKDGRGVEFQFHSLNKDGDQQAEPVAAAVPGKLEELREKIEQTPADKRVCSECGRALAEKVGIDVSKVPDADAAMRIFGEAILKDLIESTKKEILEAKDLPELRRLLSELTLIHEASKREFATQFNELKALIQGREAELQGSDLETTEADIENADTLEALYKLESKVKQIALKNRKADSDEQQLLTKFYDKAYRLHERGVRDAKVGKDLETAVRKFRDFARKQKRVEDATRVVMSALQSKATSAKTGEDVSRLVRMVDDWHNAFSSNDDYEVAPYVRTISTLAGRKLAIANASKDPALREEALQDIRTMLEDAKANVGDNATATASLDRLVFGIDLESAKSQTRQAVFGAQQELMFMSPIERQIYGPELFRNAIMTGYGDLFQRAQSGYSDACYGLNYGSSSFLGGMLNFSGFTSTGGPSSMEGRIACSVARQTYQTVRTSMGREVQSARSTLERAVASQQQTQSGLPQDLGSSLFDINDPANWSLNFLPFK